MIVFFLLLCIEFLNNTKLAFYRQTRTRWSQISLVLHQLPGHPSPPSPMSPIKPNSTVRQVSTSIQVLVMEGSIPLHLQRPQCWAREEVPPPFLGKDYKTAAYLKSQSSNNPDGNNDDI